MKLTKAIISKLAFAAIAVFLFSSCEKEVPPTKSTMEGVWEVIEVTDASGTPISHNVAFPIAAFHLSSDQTVISTAGPLIMYMVYGDNKYVEIASKIDQVFNYAGLDFNGGEFFVEGGVVDRFTLELKLEGLPGQKALTDLLDILGIGQDYLDVVVYHKFLDVKVTFDDNSNNAAGEGEYNIMIWELDAGTFAEYNTKNSQGYYVLWGGWPVANFSKCKITLEKKVKDLKTIVTEAI